MDEPLVVTLAIDDASQRRFDQLRTAHFPAARNQLGAHVTLFHQLPGAELTSVRQVLTEVADRPSFGVEVTGLRMLGRGVAYLLDAEPLIAVRRQLAVRWEDWLTPQDRQPFRAHVTVQNKASPAAARALHRQLTAEFVPSTVTAGGLDLWRYLGGPWCPVGRYVFADVQ